MSDYESRFNVLFTFGAFWIVAVCLHLVGEGIKMYFWILDTLSPPISTTLSSWLEASKPLALASKQFKHFCINVLTFNCLREYDFLGSNFENLDTPSSSPSANSCFTRDRSALLESDPVKQIFSNYCIVKNQTYQTYQDYWGNHRRRRSHQSVSFWRMGHRHHRPKR